MAALTKCYSKPLSFSLHFQATKFFSAWIIKLDSRKIANIPLLEAATPLLAELLSGRALPLKYLGTYRRFRFGCRLYVLDPVVVLAVGRAPAHGALAPGAPAHEEGYHGSPWDGVGVENPGRQ